MLAGTNETMMAGALSLALAYINRLCLASEDSVSGGSAGGGRMANGVRDTDVMSMNARILVLSVSGDLSTQYVSMMNSIFAAQRKVGDSLMKSRFHNIYFTNGLFRKFLSTSAKLLVKQSFFNKLPMPLGVSTCSLSILKVFYSI